MPKGPQGPRLIASGLLFFSLVTNAFGQTDGPLPPGKPAGVHQAVLQSTEDTILIGMLVLGAGACVIAVAEGSKGSSTSVATSTSP